jgi:pimeloyl-ACP methyl ester carboxylesterase
MSERTIRADGLELATQSFGNPAHPPVLLIMGGMASMLWWPDGFCRRLAARGRFVIRYDQRDTGLSSKFPPGRPGYGFEDAVDDVFRLLDGYGLSAAHVVGFSMGGMIGQGAALTRPERVLSLTVISSTPIGMDRSHLPKSGEAWLQHMAVEVDWSDRAATVAYEVEDARLIAGTAYGFDEPGTRAFVEKDFDRSGGYLNATNHIVLLRGGEAWRGRLGDLRAPLLVIHGTADPVFPVEHGVTLSAAVAGARLLKLEGGGHEVHSGHWDRIVEAIAEHTGSKRAVDRR